MKKAIDFGGRSVHILFFDKTDMRRCSGGLGLCPDTRGRCTASRWFDAGWWLFFFFGKFTTSSLKLSRDRRGDLRVLFESLVHELWRLLFLLLFYFLEKAKKAVAFFQEGYIVHRNFQKYCGTVSKNRRDHVEPCRH